MFLVKNGFKVNSKRVPTDSRKAKKIKGWRRLAKIKIMVFFGEFILTSLAGFFYMGVVAMNSPPIHSCQGLAQIIPINFLIKMRKLEFGGS